MVEVIEHIFFCLHPAQVSIVDYLILSVGLLDRCCLQWLIPYLVITMIVIWILVASEKFLPILTVSCKYKHVQ